ncbi:pentapeptide repeat-containing protein [Amycolatopsis sp.]|uniref:pentapeptide repeat-containing protein n=1 Tax=Amycolatopsis sp. TaxID=37632 RepID=UPI002BDF3FAB|nr:pentapeptide repeat-containing protein [Amycolatopsis sp.]HVV09611.1 pentapeptide repeat-containing protein [Amycolatopsis sp.]
MTGRPPWRSPLLGTFALSVVLLVGVSGWLLTDPATTRADALRTGGLAAGAVVALYALWLNDRRRKVEENRQQTERERYELELLRADRDRSRVTDERFAKSIELLGSEADQVRVGAMHALAGVARGEPGYTQTVLDVLCSYLRRPFENPHLAEESDPEAERELQVRLTAQRLIAELLPTVDSPEPGFDLDLTGASLEYFDLSGHRVGTLVLRYATLLSSNNFSDCRFDGPAWFTRSAIGRGRLSGRFRCRGTVFEGRAWFSGTEFGAPADFTGTIFRGEVNFRDAEFTEPPRGLPAEWEPTSSSTGDPS